MLTIRQAQMAVFSQVEMRKFEDWMVDHLKRFFPNQCKAAGEARLRETIQAGIRRAAEYQITSQRDVCKYIDLMIVFGRDFDTDQRLPWASEMLRDRKDAGYKMRDLFAAAQKHLRSA